MRLPAFSASLGDRVAIFSRPGVATTDLVKCLCGFPAEEPSRCHIECDIVVELGGAEHVVTDFSVASPGLPLCTSSGFLVTVQHELASMAMPDSIGTPSIMAAQGERLDAAIEHFHLRVFLPRDPFTLSGGEQHLIEIVGGLVSPRPIKVLRNFTENLDPHNTARVISWLSRDRSSVFLLVDSDFQVLCDIGTKYILFPSENAGVFYCLDDLLESAHVVPFVEESPLFEIGRVSHILATSRHSVPIGRIVELHRRISCVPAG